MSLVIKTHVVRDNSGFRLEFEIPIETIQGQSYIIIPIETISGHMFCIIVNQKRIKIDKSRPTLGIVRQPEFVDFY